MIPVTRCKNALVRVQGSESPIMTKSATSVGGPPSLYSARWGREQYSSVLTSKQRKRERELRLTTIKYWCTLCCRHDIGRASLDNGDICMPIYQCVFHHTRRQLLTDSILSTISRDIDSYELMHISILPKVQLLEKPKVDTTYRNYRSL